jgi:excisionase family DNA binding protein
MKQAEFARKKHPRKKFHSANCLTLSPKQAAEIAGLGLARTYRLLRQGIMPSIPDPDGKGYRIPKNALIRWLDNCQGQVTPLSKGEGRI